MQSTCAVLYCHLPFPSLQYFPMLSHKWHDFQEKVIGHKTGVFSLQPLSETFLSLRSQKGTVIYVYRYSSKVPVIRRI